MLRLFGKSKPPSIPAAETVRSVGPDAAGAEITSASATAGAPGMPETVEGFQVVHEVPQQEPQVGT